MPEFIPRLPDAPKPPHDPLHYLLDHRAGWREASLTNVELSPAGALQLAPAPGATCSLADDVGTFGGLSLPTGVAISGEGTLYLLDSRSGQLKRFDSCACGFEPVPCLGGIGAAPRQVNDPHGLGICGGNLFVCDTGNRRIQVFALRGMTLRRILGPWKLVREGPLPRLEPVSIGRPTHGAQNVCEPSLSPEFPPGVWQPWDIAFDSHGRAFVTDAANGVIHQFDRQGRWQRAFGQLSQPTHLALDRHNHLYVVEAERPDVVVFDPNGTELKRIRRADQVAPEFCPPPVGADRLGNLSLGALCHLPSASPERCDGSAPTPAEAVVFDLHGTRLAATALPKARCMMSLFETGGMYLGQALDSEIYRCQWHRVVLEGEIPPRTAVQVESFTSEIAFTLSELASVPASAWQGQSTALGPITEAWDCLIVSSPGRFLYLRLTLRGDGAATPRLQRIKVYFPRISLRRYLPAVFGENPVSADFTDRLLAIFDTIYRGIEAKLDRFAACLDPLATPAERPSKTRLDFLGWLASWMGVEQDLSLDERRRRSFLRDAACLHRFRGTAEGLRRALLLYLGWAFSRRCDRRRKPACHCDQRSFPPMAARSLSPGSAPPIILEHFKLRRWLFVGEARLGAQSVLWGKRIVNRTQLNDTARVGGTQLIATGDPVRDPFHIYAHKFSVFIPAACARDDRQRATLLRLINLGKPAHAVAQLELVEPRFRIGFQSSIGFDSVVGRYPRGFTLANHSLGRDTLLAAAQASPPTLQLGEQSRIGSSTVLD